MSQMLEDYKKNEMVTLHRSFETLAETTIKGDLIETVSNIVNTNGLFKFESSDKNPLPGENGRFVLDVIAKEADLLQTVPNAWIVYNALNEWIYSDERNKKDEGKRKELDVKLFNHMTSIYN